MEKYELTVILSEKTTAAKKKSFNERMEKLTKTMGGKIDNKDDWGKIDMAYDIKGQSAGVYLFYELELAKDKVKAVEDKLRMDDDISRYLLIKKD